MSKFRYAHLSDKELRRIRADLQLKTFANLVAKDMQLAIRMEHANKAGICECYTCGKRGHYKYMDAGHGFPGRSLSILFDERQIKPQCRYCNKERGGMPGEFHRRLAKDFGEEVVEELRKRNARTGALSEFVSGKKVSQVSHGLDHFKLADMRDGYKERIKVQKKRLG